MSTKLSILSNDATNDSGVTAVASKWNDGSRRARSAWLMTFVTEVGESCWVANFSQSSWRACAYQPATRPPSSVLGDPPPP